MAKLLVFGPDGPREINLGRKPMSLGRGEDDDVRMRRFFSHDSGDTLQIPLRVGLLGRELNERHS